MDKSGLNKQGLDKQEELNEQGLAKQEEKSPNEKMKESKWDQKEQSKWEDETFQIILKVGISGDVKATFSFTRETKITELKEFAAVQFANEQYKQFVPTGCVQLFLGEKRIGGALYETDEEKRIMKKENEKLLIDAVPQD